MKRQLDPSKKFVIYWTKPKTNNQIYYTNRFKTYEEAERRFYWLLDNDCHPSWLKCGDDRED